MKRLINHMHQLFGRTSVIAPAKPQPDIVQVEQTIADIRAARLSYCGPPKLENIAQALLQVRSEGVPGRYIEAGVALGGSAILLGLLKPADVQLELYDVFAMIPPPGENDGHDAHQRYEEIRSGTSTGLGADEYYGYVEGLLDKVKGNLRRFGLTPEGGTIQLVPGLFEDTLHPVGPVALAHIDCDWYDSVRVCIERIAPQLAPGGVMIFDDYSSYSGCQRAVDEWLAQDRTMETIFHRRSLGVRRVN
jgi:asparagine synthase (glutamine-hydrolysing)